MSIRVALHHKTEYIYDRAVTLMPHVVRLRPAPHCRTPILSYSLRVEPGSHFLNWQQDAYSNYLARLVFLKPARSFSVEVDLIAEMRTINPFDFFIESDAEQFPFRYDPVIARELTPYLETPELGPLLAELVLDQRRAGIRTIDFLVGINQFLKNEIEYVIRMEPGVQTCEQTLSQKKGSCRDTAHLMVHLLRNLGLAARFVSGYLIQLTPDVKSLDGPSGTEQDFTDLHAWAEVYLPGAGWVGLDPTSGLFVGEGHIPLACSADPINASPISGSYSWHAEASKGDDDRCEERFHFEMSVRRVYETPRVTKPYTEEQWQAILALGDRVDRDLSDRDVRLTMGGEPTFVSIDDRDADEWNTASLGPNKRRQANELFLRMRDRFAKGGLLHFGQGKWYPGESLPRWAWGCYWRGDGEPIWENPELIADDSKHPGHDETDAERFVLCLAERLGVNPERAMPGYEDSWYYMWRERRLPVNVDPLQNQIDEPEERQRLAKIFEQGLKKVVGYALPLRRRVEDGRWESGQWRLRQEHLFLLPGDSPMGYRLPLDSLPWEIAELRQQVIDADPSASREPLPIRLHRNQPFKRSPEITPQDQLKRNGTIGPAAGVIRTALCVESREGRLHVFLPPVTTLEGYLDLVTTIEVTASELRLPVMIEGYKPPSDPRLHHFLITPDPGVVEVNIHPSRDWRELVDHTTTLYDEAHLSRLSTEKFMLDGRHVGTGGGNHIVIGGPTVADSPLLRRPDLLRSLIACWHNHPSLSYLFSSMFVGPTSQAPRVDEARDDHVYEMEIAFQQVPDKQDVPPWLVDRIFRHLLTDITGNTHRAEFCIDKLYSPDSAEGRRGLLELRAFEMPPHSQMSLVQQLLIRTLIAQFWKHPYPHRLVRWGTELHDRFLLPHFVERDFDDLLHELNQAGYPLRKEWFAPHLEFRFPQLGEVALNDIYIELRQAIEPWHVLGEEATGNGTARYVDSSVERLQILVRGMVDPRHLVLCNGVRLPLHPTGTRGEFVAGVRYRAWQPPSALHPTIGVHVPLVFDVYDTWNQRSLGGCQYHVAHPGGLSYENFPVNAYEAESRRHNRFLPFGHTPGVRSVLTVETPSEFPFTLDLRRVSEQSSEIGASGTSTQRATMNRRSRRIVSLSEEGVLDS